MTTVNRTSPSRTAASPGSGPRTDSVLSAWLGRPVTLAPAEAAPGANAEYFADATDDTSPAIEWTMPGGRFVDTMPLLVLTTASLRAATALHPAGDWDTRRFRSNLLVDIDTDGWIEDGWCGRLLRIGTVAIVPRHRASVARWSPAHSPGSNATSTSTRPSADTTTAPSACGRECKHQAPFTSATL